MLKLVARRILESIPLLLAISFVTFFLLFHSPGDYLAQLRLDPKIPSEYIDREIERLGLDKPFYQIWARWLWGIVRHGDFGRSFAYKVPVWDLIGSRLFNTFILSLAALLFAWVISIPLGIIAAVKQNKIPDRVASAIAFFGLSIPAVLLALLAVFFAARTGAFPTGGMTSSHHYQLDSTWERMKDILHHLILPAVVLGMTGLAVTTRQMRSNLLDTLKADYVRTALSKGISYRSAVLKHAFRNALNPLITLFGFAFSDLLSGAFLVENVMGWPGLGRLTIEAMMSKDMFVVAGSVLMASVMLIVGNLLADILLGLNDPRIRYD
jgi:peptide/nickel transport system permease protein